jgi:hypothetical protein
MITCVACRGEGVREWRCYAAGASPCDQTVRCDLCYGTGLCSEREAEQWRQFPTVPPMPERRAVA